MFLFVPILAFLYFVAPYRWKIFILGLFSFLFCVWGQGFLVSVLLLIVIITYLLSWSMKYWKKGPLIVGIILNVGCLIAFKYSNFIIDNTQILEWGIDKVNWIAPLGLSFVVFMAISYLIDVYRGETVFSRNPLKLIFYLLFFPKVISGPLDRYNEIAVQIPDRQARIEQISSGIKKFVVGLGKKVLIANVLSVVVDQIFAIPVDSLPVATAWLGAICFTLQIYFDFSGYTDMAIGISRIFGFELLENFNYPYISRSIQEFWRRWHITLSRWLKNYLYIPLGGNKIHTSINILVVFLICGIWHGASWTFVVWGLWYGIFLVIERQLMHRIQIPELFRHIYVLLIIVIGWVIFRSSSIDYAWGYIKSMFGFGSDGFGSDNSVYSVFVYISALLIVTVIAGVIGSLPVVSWLSRIRNKYSQWNIVYSVCVITVLLSIFALSIMEISGGFYKPFLYGQF
jgi:alginate O-acetyltransferase complex protein AlgI